jgi:ATP-dependent RNA helicase DeaD
MTNNPDGFESLGLGPLLLAGLTQLGYEEPTPIQREAIPLLLEGRDLFGQAATGTGKTAAFALPMLHRMKPGTQGPFEAAALVLVPTRELAVQVAEAVHSYGKSMGVSVLPIYGGQEFSHQLRRLKHGVDVVVATPGRALDHLRRKTLKLGKVQMVVLDEADEMLDMGFAEDLEAILSELPSERQTALFSATLPPRIAAISTRHLKNPARLTIKAEAPAKGSAPRVRQTAYFVSRNQKIAALGRVLDLEAPKSAIVFCRTRNEVDSLTDTLQGLGFQAESLHGGMTQEQRDRVLKRFKAHTTETLVATDVAARGLHIEKLSHVVNYDLPTSPESYVHRIGRTGRAGQEGVAISFVDPREKRLLKNIERVTGQRIEIALVPTGADLRARKLGLIQASLREALLAGELDPYRVVVESLASESDVVEIAAAAIKLLHSAEGEREHAEVPAVQPPPVTWITPPAERAPRRPPGKPTEARRPSTPEAHRPSATENRRPSAPEAHRLPPTEAHRPPPMENRRPSATENRRPSAPEARRSSAMEAREPSRGDLVKLFVGAGRHAGIRPADLVGAIANEAGIAPQQIGSIQITDVYSLVEVPSAVAGRVMGALRQTTLRGRKVRVDIQKPGKGPSSRSRPS